MSRPGWAGVQPAPCPSVRLHAGLINEDPPQARAGDTDVPTPPRPPVSSSPAPSSSSPSSLNHPPPHIMAEAPVPSPSPHQAIASRLAHRGVYMRHPRHVWPRRGAGAAWGGSPGPTLVENVQFLFGSLKKCLTPIRYHLTPIRMATLNQSDEEDVEKLGSLPAVEGRQTGQPLWEMVALLRGKRIKTGTAARHSKPLPGASRTRSRRV